jgi:hypothetical protein
LYQTRYDACEDARNWSLTSNTVLKIKYSVGVSDFRADCSNVNDTSPEAGVYIHLPNPKVSGRQDPRVCDHSIEDSSTPPHLPPPLVRGQPPASGESPAGVLPVVRLWDRIRLQKLVISVNTPLTRDFSSKVPEYKSCAAGAPSGDFVQFWAFQGCIAQIRR